MEDLEISKLKEIVEAKGHILPPKSEWELFRFEIGSYIGIVYSSGRVVYHEPLSEVIELALCEKEGVDIGSDEAGKGEGTGPIVVAAVALDQEARRYLRARGLLESKSLPLSRLEETSLMIMRKAKAWNVKIIHPEMLKRLWRRGNLNELLASWHHEVIQRTVEVVRPKRIIVDSFDDKRLREELKELESIAELIIKPKADLTYTSVAAASVLARYHRERESIGDAKWN